MLSRWVDQLLEAADDEQLYEDAGREMPSRPGELTRTDVARAHQALQTLLKNPDEDTWVW